jgi:ubiquinol-cytochrome c reductase cytochrome b subunit
MYIAHVLIIPLLIAGLLGLHLFGIVARHHTQFGLKPKQTERRVVGMPTFPGYAPRSLGLLCSVAGLLFLLGGLVQINPVWLWGPYHVSDATNGAQPDWYLGWLIGGLRLVPSFDVVIGSYTLIPNAFWGGAGFPLFVFLLLAAWPWLERKVTGDHAVHNLLDRPRDKPWRTAFGVWLLTWVFMVFLFGTADRIVVFFGLSYVDQLWAYRVLVWVLPVVLAAIAYRVCVDLQANEPVERRRKRAEQEAEAAVR